MKTRGIVFLTEWILANLFVWKGLDDAHSFSTMPWMLWNITFGIFLFKLFVAPEDANENAVSVWPIGPTVGAFGFVLTAINVKVNNSSNITHEDDNNHFLSGTMSVSFNIILGCFVCLFGFVLIGISSDALGDEWRDAPPPDSSDENGDVERNTSVGEKSGLLESTSSGSRETGHRSTRNNLVTDGPYGIIRHPIYCGLLLEAFGSNVVGGFESWIALAALVSVTTAYIVQLNQEEHELNRLIDGKYDSDYKQRTKYKLIPFIF